MKPNKLLAPAILQAASAVNAKGLGLEIYKQYITYFGKQTCTLCAFFLSTCYTSTIHILYIAKHDYYGLSK